MKSNHKLGRRLEITVTRTQAIKAFLTAKTHKDLASLYSYDMEVQVNVAQDNGERIEGEYQGRLWHGWTDNIQTWKSFRVPYNAKTNPEYTDTPMKFDLSEHALGIGMTGWDWKNKCSRWVAFDFDSIADHSGKGLTTKELDEVKFKASEIPWVTVRLSTSGKGLHMYVYLEPVSTKNHTEHAALARSILGMMSALVGYDFNTKVDICGGNMWVWHRKMVGTEGLNIIKNGTILTKVSVNWKDHIKVVKRQNQRSTPSFIDVKEKDDFEELVNGYAQIKLDEDHQRLIKQLHDSESLFWWDSDRHMLVAHTWDLMKAHSALNFKGIFKTLSTGKEHGQDHNCFCVPVRNGGWIIRRFSPGVNEELSWSQDENGWTRCFLNVDPTLNIVASTHLGIEDENKRFTFRFASQAQEAVLALGTDIAIPETYKNRKTTVKHHKDGQRIVVEIERQAEDSQDEVSGWGATKRNTWQKIFSVKRTNPVAIETANFDDVIRHLVSSDGSDCGWSVKSDGKWHDEPLLHAKYALESMGLKTTETKSIIGSSVFKPWMIVNQPFKDEYPGSRQWNRNAAQLRFGLSSSETLNYSTWLKILNHVGSGLDIAIQENRWAQDNGLKTGADYLKCWIASLFQFPMEPLPFLFLWGPQNSGKSILHEALSLLLTNGYCRADTALTDNYNAELSNSILCIVEELNLKKDRVANNRIKDWVTSIYLLVKEKYRTPRLIRNMTHWIMCSNERSAVPVFPDDTRITMCFVDSLQEIIPKRDLLETLKKEAPDFLTAVMRLEIPKANDRLNLPVISTYDKEEAASANKSMLELFIDECCFYVPGNMIPVKEFFEAFQKWLEPNERFNWTKIKTNRYLPYKFPKGRDPRTSVWNIGNVSFDKSEPIGSPLVLHKDTLVQKGT